MSLDERFEDDLDEERVPNLGIVAESISQLGIDVLLSGETGTGKDTIARRIHEMSGRKGRLVAMNCAAIPESLAESELFGVVSGAYTGADAPESVMSKRRRAARCTWMRSIVCR